MSVLDENTPLIQNDTNIPHGKSSIISVLGNFINVLVGAGILGMPFVFKISGITGGCFIIFSFGLMTIYTLSLLIKSAIKSNVFHYEKLCYYCFGDFGYIYVSLCLFILDYGACLTLLIILADNLFLILHIFNYDSYHHRQISLLLISLIFIFPLCLYRDISYMSMLSWIKTLSIISIIFVVFYECFTTTNNNKHNNIEYGVTVNQMEISFGIISFAFVCHDTSFLFYNTLHNPTKMRWNTVLFIGVFFAVLLCMLLSFPAYFTFDINVQSNILNNYSIKEGIIIGVRVIYIIAMILTYPMSFFVVRHVFVAFTQKYGLFNRCFNSLKAKSAYLRRIIVSKINKDNDVYNIDHNAIDEFHEYNVHSLPLNAHIIFSSILFFSNIFIGLFVDNLGITMGIIGNIASINLGFVLPCICYLKTCVNYKDIMDSKISFGDKIYIVIEIVLCVGIAIIGIYIVIWGTYSIIINNTKK